jgi:hypothetical protein
MSGRFPKCLVVLAIIFAMGMHWAILQSVAWTGMVISYSQHSSIQEAFRKTFDGQHPCSICKLVKAGQASEQQQDQQRLLLKLDIFVQAPVDGSLFAPSLEELRTHSVLVLAERPTTPLAPPPKLG